LPVYITAGTLGNSRLHLDENLVKPFSAYEEIKIGGLTITAFPKEHDASEPHSFIIKGADTTIGVLTDIGVGCEHVVSNFKQCHAVFLETNYDEKMLEEGNYPYHLKRRISGGKGHLSNTQALEIFTKHKPGFMSHVFLSHLSRDNNNPEMVLELFSKHAGHTHVSVASRYQESAVYHITNGHDSQTSVVEMPQVFKAQQISLF
jgi:phosphoribosyl 1,2-cyclic phosphodiesterase